MELFSYIGLSKPFHKKRAGLVLEWEEGATVSDLNTAGVLNKPRRLWLMPILTVLAVLVLGSRLVWVQVIKGELYAGLSDGNRIRERILLAPRGLVVDSYGEILADNTAKYRLAVYPVDIPANLRMTVANSLSDIVSGEANELDKRITEHGKKSQDPLILLDNLDAQKRVSIASKVAGLPGVSLEAIPTRAYKEPLVFSHILGYTGRIGETQLEKLVKQGYSRQDIVGKNGVENVYESFLKGKNGARKFEVDAKGRITADLGEEVPVIGNTVELEIDAGLQQQLYASLSKRGALGAAVVLDPRDGAVRALVSLPGYDIDEMSRGIGVEAGKAIFSNPDLPLFNRAIQGVYPPGSTVKPMLAAAAINEGIVTDKTVIVDRGYLTVPNRYNPSIIYNFYGWKRDGLGPLNVYGAVARSSDIYFYVVGGGHPSSPVEGLGVGRLAGYYRRFGLGKATGIDLLGEATGTVPDPAWKEKHFEEDPVMQKWFLGDTYHLSIGQGFLLSTPLQAALWASTLANDGIGFKPHLLKSVKDKDGRIIQQAKTEVIVRPEIDKKALDIAKETMVETVKVGSGKPLLSLPVTSAGKTGTSQFDGADPSRTHAWFIAYAPAEKPEIAIAVLVEAGGEGHAVAVPTAKEALQWWAENRYCKQTYAVCKK